MIRTAGRELLVIAIGAIAGSWALTALFAILTVTGEPSAINAVIGCGICAVAFTCATIAGLYLGGRD
jgi:steroid 5-alpha reductase family enzyme